VLAEPRAAGLTIYVAAGADPVDAALAAALP
jgi:hypothetical protein